VAARIDRRVDRLAGQADLDLLGTAVASFPDTILPDICNIFDIRIFGGSEHYVNPPR
jgi:hypothetical protein